MRERVRLLAADGFTRGEENSVIAKRLRGSVRSGEGGAGPGVRESERLRESERHCARRALAKGPKVEESDFAALEPLLLEHLRALRVRQGAAAMAEVVYQRAP